MGNFFDGARPGAAAGQQPRNMFGAHHWGAGGNRLGG